MIYYTIYGFKYIIKNKIFEFCKKTRKTLPLIVSYIGSNILYNVKYLMLEETNTKKSNNHILLFFVNILFADKLYKTVRLF
jgi:hypothetical protein